jgi:GntR family transcriptional regulator of arabinose operon
VIRRRKAGTVVADRSILPDTKIALVFTALSELPQVAYLSGIEESLADGYQLVPMGTSHSPRDEARCFERTLTECSAMICYPTGAQENNVLLKKIVDTMPVIFVDRLPEDIDADVVMTDNFSSMMMGLKYLQSQGHTRIAYFMEDKLHLSSVRDRYSAYQQFIREECGVVDTDRWVRRFSIATPWEQYYDKIEAVLAELLSDTGPNRVTAVACQQDMLMAAVLEACVHIGVTVPTELKNAAVDEERQQTCATLGRDGQYGRPAHPTAPDIRRSAVAADASARRPLSRRHAYLERCRPRFHRFSPILETLIRPTVRKVAASVCMITIA